MAEYGDIYYSSSDGLRLYARDYSCRNERIAQPDTILCMHGLTRNSADFAHLATHLSEKYRVLAVDNRGRGLSQYDANAANYNPATCVNDMFTLLGVLDLERVILCGTSMGGIMAMMMAAMQPGTVTGMIINDIGPVIAEEGLQRIKAYVGKAKPVTSWADAIAQSKEVNQLAFPDFSDSEWEEFTRGLYRDQNGMPVLAYDPAISKPLSDEQSAAVPPDLWPLYDAVTTIPMLLIRGATSDILAPACVQAMRDKKQDLRFVEVPNRGHAPTLNEAVSRGAIDEFLAALQ